MYVTIIHFISGVTIRWPGGHKAAHGLTTADRGEPEVHRLSLNIEHMSCYTFCNVLLFSLKNNK